MGQDQDEEKTLNPGYIRNWSGQELLDGKDDYVREESRMIPRLFIQTIGRMK